MKPAFKQIHTGILLSFNYSQETSCTYSPRDNTEHKLFQQMHLQYMYTVGLQICPLSQACQDRKTKATNPAHADIQVHLQNSRETTGSTCTYVYQTVN